jgi:hypothetical protein
MIPCCLARANDGKVCILSLAIKQQYFASVQGHLLLYPKLIHLLIHEVCRYLVAFKSKIANELWKNLTTMKCYLLNNYWHFAERPRNNLTILSA